MAKEKKKRRPRIEKYVKRREDYHNNVKEEDRNPDAKEDFDKVLRGLIELKPDQQKDELD